MLILESLGDMQGAQSKIAIVERLRGLAMRQLVPRNKGAQTRKIPHYSPLRIRRGW
jgi:hypothetical protein